jgi:hypothetical protein
MLKRARKTRSEDILMVSDLEQTLNLAIFLKYIILALFAIIFFIAMSYDITTNSFSVASAIKVLKENIVSAVLVSLMMAIFYDLVIKRQQDKSQQIAAHKVCSYVLNNLYSDYIVKNACASDIMEFVMSISTRDDFRYALAKLISNDDATASSIKDTYLRPLFDPPHLRDVRLDSTIWSLEDQQTIYRWKMSERFVMNGSNREFILMCMKDTAAVNAIMASKFRCDHLILLSNRTNSSCHEFLSKSIKLRGSVLNQGIEEPIHWQFNDISNDLNEFLKQFGDGIEISGIKAIASEADRTINCELEYEQEMSLDDPYFYNSATSYVIAREINIDYSGIRKCLDHVSSLSMISNKSARLMHDSSRGKVNLRVDGLLQPGEGVLIIWTKKLCKDLN